MDCEQIPQKVYFEMLEENKNGRRIKERDQLLQALSEYRHKMLALRKQLELSLLSRVTSRDGEAAKRKFKPKPRNFKLRNYVGRGDYSVYKILNNLEEAVQNVLHGKDQDSESPNPKGIKEQKDIQLDDPIEDTEIKVLEIEKILSEINGELTALKQEGSEYEKCGRELIFAKDDGGFLLEDIKGIYKFSSATGEERYETLLSCMMSLKAGTRVVRHCFCKEVIPKRNSKFHLLGKVEPTEAEKLMISRMAMPPEPPITDAVKHFGIELQETFERPDIFYAPGMSEMKAKCPTPKEIMTKYEKFVEGVKLKEDERNARRELIRNMRQERRQESEDGKAAGNETQTDNQSLNRYQLTMLRCTQMMAMSDSFIELLMETKEKLKLTHDLLLRCLNKASATADTERKYLTYLASS